MCSALIEHVTHSNLASPQRFTFLSVCALSGSEKFPQSLLSEDAEFEHNKQNSTKKYKILQKRTGMEIKY